jgi:hypothetical protein
MKIRYIVFASLFTVMGSAIAEVDPAVKATFDKIDGDADGQITEKEFGAKPEIIKETHLHGYGCFQQADIDKSGTLSLEEWDAYEEEIPCE